VCVLKRGIAVQVLLPGIEKLTFLIVSPRRFPDERSDSFQQPGNRGGRFEEYKGDHSFDRKPQRSQGDYDYQPAQSGAFDSDPLPPFTPQEPRKSHMFSPLPPTNQSPFSCNSWTVINLPEDFVGMQIAVKTAS
jgi:hypothetical protein